MIESWKFNSGDFFQPMEPISKRLAICSAGLFGGLLGVSAAVAQETSDVAQLPTLRVSGSYGGTGATSYRAGYSSTGDKMEVPYLQQSRTVDTVSAQVIEDQAPQTMEDMIKFVPGIAVGNNFGGTQDGLLKRGFGNTDDGGTLLDGVRMPVGRSFQAVTTERVEFLKGPASLFYGMQEPGGVINVITKKPLYQWQRILGGNLSSHGGGDAYFDVTGPLKDTGWAVRVIGQGKNEDYWRNFGENKQQLFAPSLSYEGEDLSFLLAYQYLDYDNTLDRGAVIQDGHYVGSRDKRLDEPWTASKGIRQVVSSTTEYRFDQDTRVKLTLGWNQDHYNDYQADPRGYNTETGELSRRFRRNTGADRENVYVALDWIASRQWLDMEHELLVGVDYDLRRDVSGDFIDGPVVGGFFPDHPEYGRLDPEGPVNPNNSDNYQRISGNAFYFKDNIHLNDRWILAPGLRYQHYDVKIGGHQPFVVSTDESDAKLLPFIGLVYQARSDLSLYANYSQSYRPNEFTPGSTVEGSYEPETGRQYEIGAKYDSGGWTTQLALFDIRKENVQQVAGEDDAGNTLQRLAGEVSSRGIEWSLSGELSEDWSLIANYAYTDAKVEKDTPQTEGNQLFNVPKNAAGAYLAYDLPAEVLDGRMRIGAGARYVGKRYGNLDNSFTLPAYTSVDAFVSWKTPRLLGNETSLQLNVTNLTNREYFVSSGGNPNRVSWGEDRTLRLKGEIRF